MNEVGFGNLNIKYYKSLKAIKRLQFEEKWNSWIPTRTDKKNGNYNCLPWIFIQKNRIKQDFFL